MSDLKLNWADVLDGFRREMIGDNDRERVRNAARLLLAVAREGLTRTGARSVLEMALIARLGALYPRQGATAVQVVASLSDQAIAESLLVDDRGLGLGNPHFEELAYPRKVAAGV
jgi:hypothetical protein